MRPRHAIALTAALASTCVAQTPSFIGDSRVSFTLRWAEHNGNSNGAVEPPARASSSTTPILYSSYSRS